MLDILRTLADQARARRNPLPLRFRPFSRPPGCPPTATRPSSTSPAWPRVTAGARWPQPSHRFPPTRPLLDPVCPPGCPAPRPVPTDEYQHAVDVPAVRGSRLPTGRPRLKIKTRSDRLHESSLQQAIDRPFNLRFCFGRKRSRKAAHGNRLVSLLQEPQEYIARCHIPAIGRQTGDANGHHSWAARPVRKSAQTASRLR